VAPDRPPWGWRLQRAWLQGHARWWLWFACLVLGSLAMGVAWMSHQRAQERLVDLDVQLKQARADAQPPSPIASPIEKDFAQSLGASSHTAQVLQELQRASSAAGVLLASVQAQEHAASAEQLGHLELAVMLRGPYPGTKQVLKQVLERFPNITLQRLRMRRSQSPVDVETGVTLSVWSAPMPASAEPPHGVSSARAR